MVKPIDKDSPNPSNVGECSAAKRSAIWGQSLPADHFEKALYKRSAKGLPEAIEVCQKKILIEIG